MADNVRWIQMKVGMFDGNSFKRIKRAKIGGVNYRDKLTAVWFELMDLAGKGNQNGFLVDGNGIPFQKENYEDIAILLDRESEEIQLCMGFYIGEKMVEIIDDMYCLPNFMKYQSEQGLEKIREATRLRVQKHREKVKEVSEGICNVTPSVTKALPSISISKSISNNSNKKIIQPTKEEVEEYSKTRGREDLAKQFYDYYTATNWHDKDGKPVKSWKGKFITWEGRNPPPSSSGMSKYMKKGRNYDEE